MKRVLSIIVGIVVGFCYASLILWFVGYRFGMLIFAVSIVGFSVWFSRLPTVKSILVAAAVCFGGYVLLALMAKPIEEARMRKGLQALQEHLEQREGSASP